MKKLTKRIIICLFIIIFIIVYNNIHLFPFLWVKIMSRDSINSYIVIEEKNYLSYICSTEKNLIEFTFTKKDKFAWRYLTKTVYDVKDIFDARLNFQYSAINRNEHIIIYGICNDKKITSLSIYNYDDEIICYITPNETGLFAIKITDSIKFIKQIYGFNDNGQVIYSRKLFE